MSITVRYFASLKDRMGRDHDVVAASQCILEINTGGIVRGTSGALYPSQWILADDIISFRPPKP